MTTEQKNSQFKVIIAGAGHGGLIAGAKLAENGINVEMYESAQRDTIGWDWHDDMDIRVFNTLDMELPKSDIYFRKNDWTFLSPNKEAKISITVPEEEKDVSIERKALLKQFIDFAENKGVKIHFGQGVKEPIIKDDTIIGFKLNDNTEINGNFVIDATGLNSPLRKNLPESYGIDKELKRGERFYGWRAFYDQVEGKTPDHLSKVYLKHMGNIGISWVIIDPHDQVNVLIGQIDPLTDQDVERVLKDLRESNPWLGEKVMRGGQFAEIPVRRPLTKMIGTNYAAIGDAAFMTIPIMGSGIAASMVAGDILADVLLKNFNNGAVFSPENLWEYQVKFFHQLGAQFSGIECMKNFLLGVKPNELDFLFANKIITPEDLTVVTAGREINIPLIEMIPRAIKGISKVDCLLKIKGAIDKSARVKKFAMKIPETYDEARINAWSKKLNRFFS